MDAILDVFWRLAVTGSFTYCAFALLRAATRKAQDKTYIQCWTCRDYKPAEEITFGLARVNGQNVPLCKDCCPAMGVTHSHQEAA